LKNEKSVDKGVNFLPEVPLNEKRSKEKDPELKEAIIDLKDFIFP